MDLRRNQIPIRFIFLTFYSANVIFINSTSAVGTIILVNFDSFGLERHKLCRLTVVLTILFSLEAYILLDNILHRLCSTKKGSKLMTYIFDSFFSIICNVISGKVIFNQDYTLPTPIWSLSFRHRLVLGRRPLCGVMSSVRFERIGHLSNRTNHAVLMISIPLFSLFSDSETFDLHRHIFFIFPDFIFFRV